MGLLSASQGHDVRFAGNWHGVDPLLDSLRSTFAFWSVCTAHPSLYLCCIQCNILVGLEQFSELFIATCSTDI